MIKNNRVYVGFPNLDPIDIDVSIVSEWKIREPRQIGSVTFFWVADTYCQMDTSDFKMIFNEEV